MAAAAPRADHPLQLQEVPLIPEGWWSVYRHFDSDPRPLGAARINNTAE